MFKVKTPRSAGKPTSLFVEIDPRVARIGVAPDSWAGVSEPVLLVVAQFWRFFAIDRTLDEIGEWLRNDLDTGNVARLFNRRRSRTLYTHRHALQRLILDLPDFESPLTNPEAFLNPGRPVRIYRALARQLALHRFRCAIDERIEVIEAVFDSLTESHNHYQSLAFQITLELIIAALLLFDIGLYLRG